MLAKVLFRVRWVLIGSEVIHYLKNEIEHLMLPDSILFFMMDNVYCRLLSKDFESDNRPVYFSSSGVLLLNRAGSKYKNNDHNRLFT